MKKNTAISLICILFLVSVMVFTGCSNQYVDDSKAIIEDYYESFNDYGADDILDLLDEDLIEDIGGKEDAPILFESRIGTLGEDVDYTIVGTSYQKNNKDK